MAYQLDMIRNFLKLCWNTCFLDNRDIVSSHDPSIEASCMQYIWFHRWMEDLLGRRIFERCCPKQSLKYRFEPLVWLRRLELKLGKHWLLVDKCLNLLSIQMVRYKRYILHWHCKELILDTHKFEYLCSRLEFIRILICRPFHQRSKRMVINR